MNWAIKAVGNNTNRFGAIRVRCSISSDCINIISERVVLVCMEIDPFVAGSFVGCRSSGGLFRLLDS